MRPTKLIWNANLSNPLNLAFQWEPIKTVAAYATIIVSPEAKAESDSESVSESESEAEAAATKSEAQSWGRFRPRANSPTCR